MCTHRKAASAATSPPDSRPPSSTSEPLDYEMATKVPDEERRIERGTRRGGRERGERGEESERGEERRGGGYVALA